MYRASILTTTTASSTATQRFTHLRNRERIAPGRLEAQLRRGSPDDRVSIEPGRTDIQSSCRRLGFRLARNISEPETIQHSLRTTDLRSASFDLSQSGPSSLHCLVGHDPSDVHRNIVGSDSSLPPVIEPFAVPNQLPAEHHSTLVYIGPPDSASSPPSCRPSSQLSFSLVPPPPSPILLHQLVADCSLVPIQYERLSLL